MADSKAPVDKRRIQTALDHIVKQTGEIYRLAIVAHGGGATRKWPRRPQVHQKH